MAAQVPAALPFKPPSDGSPEAIAAAKRQNEAVVARSKVASWLPVLPDQARRREARQGAPARPVPPRAPPDSFSGLGMLTVLTVDLTKGLQPVDSAAVMTDGRIVYASPESLYVATERWADRPDPDKPTEQQTGAQTEIHKFDISSPVKTQYRGSGRVSGFLLSQWSLSEYRGVLRVVSTESPAWWGAGGETESFLTTLRPSGGRLVQAGRVGGLGKGERVYSVRFVGDTGYVVTFRQIDPLFTLDLSQPERPRVLGELKIPGYSAYLHPIGEDLLLGVGQDADENGRPLGTQLSIFDVSDLRKPTRLYTQHLGQGWSEAEHDHHAFLFWPRTGLVMIPFEQRAVGFRVGRSPRDRPARQGRARPGLSDPPLAGRPRQRAHGLGQRRQGEQPGDARRARLGCVSGHEAVTRLRLALLVDSARLRSEPSERRTMRRVLFIAASVAVVATVVVAGDRCAAAARTHQELCRPLRRRHVTRLGAPGGSCRRRLPRQREPACRRRDGDVVEPDVRRRPGPPGRRPRRRPQQAGRLQRAGDAPAPLGRAVDRRRAGERPRSSRPALPRPWPPSRSPAGNGTWR